MKHQKFSVLILCLFALFVVLPFPASLNAEDNFWVPEELAPWKEWIREKHPEWECAVLSEGASQCVWPGKIRYTLSEREGSFQVDVRMLQEGEVEIPSSGALYPSELTVHDDQGNSVEVRSQVRKSRVMIKLPAGQFTISGSFRWNQIPSELPLPSSYGLFDLDAPRQEINVRRGSKSVWIEEQDAGKAAEQLSVSVFRKITDHSPMEIETLIRLRVSGTNRAVNLGKVILPNTTPVKSTSRLPHYLSTDGALGLQLTPGEHEVRVTAVTGQPVGAVQSPSPPLPEWPKEEIWAFFARPSLRSVAVKGASPVQASLTQLPSEWYGGATYVVPAGADVTFDLLRRGEQKVAKNTISLRRELWPDLSGSGFTVRDQFNGTMNKGFRLNALGSTELGRASVNGQPALVTKDSQNKLLGIELRDQNLNVSTVSRLKERSGVSAVGWNTTVDSLGYTLHLPPSWLLFHVSGADSGNGTWIESWSLLDIFIALLIVLGSFKLFGLPVAAISGALLLLGHNEFLAPRVFLIYVLIFFAWRKLAEGRGKGWEIASGLCLGVTFAALTLQLLAFAKLQFIQMLFPQLQSGTRYTTFIQSVLESLETSLFIWPYLLLLAVIVIFAIRSLFRSTGFWNFLGRSALYCIGFIVAALFLGPLAFQAGYMPGPASQQATFQSVELQLADSASRYAGARVMSKKAVVAQEAPVDKQFSYESKNLLSGPAVPTWKWRSHQLSVPGPVDPAYEVSFVLFAPWLIRILCGLRVLTALLLIALLFQALGYADRLKPYAERAAQLASLLPFLLLFQPETARAEFPPPNLLSELEARMQKEGCSEKTCATLEEVDLTINGSRFTLRAAVSSDGRSAVSLPGPLDVFLPTSVQRDGSEIVSMRRTSDGFLQVQTEDGRNTLEVTGVLPLESSFSLQFQTRPLFTQVTTDDWFIEGLSPSGFIRDSLRFTRRNSDPQGSETAAQLEETSPADLPSWFKIDRSITIGEQVRSRLEITRIGTLGKSVQIRVPLLDNERITSGAATIENGYLLARFGPSTERMRFGGELPYAGELHLKAPAKKNMSERWTVRCLPIIHCEADGLHPTHSVYGGKNASVWFPFPKETVTVTYEDLSGIKGEFLTIDEATYDIRWGAQQLSGDLRVTARVTEQTTFSVTTPADSTIQQLSVGGVSGGSDISKNKGVVLLNPGEHTISALYSLPWHAGLFEVAPAVKLSAPSHNVSINIHPSSDRWLIWTGGLSWGPSVLFWGKLLFIVALCVGLSLVSLIPMKPLSAALLGIGLTSIPIVWMTIPLAWLVALKLIPLMHDQWTRVAKPLRLGIFVGLSVFALVWFFKIVQLGLVLQPPMLVVGNQSNAQHLKWFTDHAAAALPQPWVLSLPIWCWRVFALAWSTWLVFALFSWLRLAIDIEKTEGD